MKNLKLFCLLFILLCMGGTKAFAYETEIAGIYYNFSHADLTAEVTYGSSMVNSYAGTRTIPSSIYYKNKTYKVTSIGNMAFYRCNNLTSITIPNSVVKIGSHTFERSGITSINIPNSVKTIGEYNQEIMGKTNVEIIPVIA